eukprot:2819528-Alexandrium_andersonii.AAC.1
MAWRPAKPNISSNHFPMLEMRSECVVFSNPRAKAVGGQIRGWSRSLTLGRMVQVATCSVTVRGQGM